MYCREDTLSFIYKRAGYRFSFFIQKKEATSIEKAPFVMVNVISVLR